jgi:hypothetical protein
MVSEQLVEMLWRNCVNAVEQLHAPQSKRAADAESAARLF